MESTRTKTEVIMPVFLKAGIPIAFSVFGFIFARITTRKSSVLKAFSPSETQVNPQQIISQPFMQEEHIFTDTHYNTSSESFQIHDRHELDEIEGLRSRLEDVQERELKLEMRFLHYHDLKERELVLTELRNNLLLEMARAELLGMEVSSMEAENQRFEDMVVEYLKVLEKLDFSRLENALLHRRINRYLRRTKELSRVVNKQNLQIDDREAQILRNHEELERRAGTIKGLRDEIMELQTVTGKLQEGKNELMNKLELAENSTSLKTEEESIPMEDYNQLLNEKEQLQKERTAEVTELIYLRWCNACLRHDLMRSRNQEREENLEGKKNQLELDFVGSGEIGDFGLEQELESSIVGHGESCLGLTTGGQSHSRRGKLIGKFKRWVERSEKTKLKLDGKGKNGRNCVSEGAEEIHIPARKSCSSA